MAGLQLEGAPSGWAASVLAVGCTFPHGVSCSAGELTAASALPGGWQDTTLCSPCSPCLTCC